MDAGLAAVCGALAGSIATTGAAFVAGWWQRENARLQARSEHVRQRRQPREAVYSEFVSQVTKFSEVYGPSAPPGVALFGAERSQHVVDLYLDLRPQTIAVALAGPDEMAELAEGVEHACAPIYWDALLRKVSLRHGGERRTIDAEQLDAAFRNLREKRSEFLRAARRTLDQDGT